MDASGQPSGFLTVRVTHDLLSFFGNAAVSVAIAMEEVGSGSLTSGFFDFTWTVGSMNPALLEPFTLQPEKIGAFGNRYEVFSATGEPIATVQDHKYALFNTSVTCDYASGRLEINETTKSNLLGIVNLGMQREFTMQGSVNGIINVEDYFGNYGFDLQYDSASTSGGRLNAILAANLVLLTRSIAEHHRE